MNRRSFLIGAGCATTLAWVPARVLNALPTSQDLSLLSNLDMEVDDFAQYATATSTNLATWGRSGNPPVITSSLARAGNRSARVHLNRLTSDNSYRTEASMFGTYRHLEFQKTYWIGFSIYVPSDWTQGSTSHETMLQIHNHPDDWANSKSPMLAIRYEPNTHPGKWRLTVQYITTPESENPGNTGRIWAVVNTEHLIRTGEWTDWVIEYRPDYRLNEDGGVGVTRMWMNGTKVVDYEGPCAFNETNGPYIKFGTYKSDWKNRDSRDPAVERLYYFDELRVSKADQGSYQLVAPGGTAELRQPMPPTIEIA